MPAKPYFGLRLPNLSKILRKVRINPADKCGESAVTADKPERGTHETDSLCSQLLSSVAAGVRPERQWAGRPEPVGERAERRQESRCARQKREPVRACLETG